MKILFLHRNFPGQFKYLAEELAKDNNNEVLFITNNNKTCSFGNIKKIIYRIKRRVPKDCHRYLRFYEDAIIHGQSVAEILIELKNTGYKPDIIYGHTWGTTLFVKDIYPDVPLVCYFEWYYNSEGADVGFDGSSINADIRALLRCKNSHIMQDLINCDYGISPTIWQKSQFPEIFHDKIKVIHEGIDTNICCPNGNVEFIIPNSNKILTRADDVLTYATRGMEEYRGFPEFMKIVEKIQKIRPNVHVLIGGEDRVCYGKHLKEGTFKNKMIQELDLDLSHVHFVGNLPYKDYIKLLQVSTVHVYLTYPFVLSWSLLEAMSIGACIIASDTAPVKEVMQNGYNGFVFDFYDINSMVRKIERIFENRYECINVCKNARNLIIEKYDKNFLLKKQIEFLTNIIK